MSFRKISQSLDESLIISKANKFDYFTRLIIIANLLKQKIHFHWQSTHRMPHRDCESYFHSGSNYVRRIDQWK